MELIFTCYFALISKHPSIPVKVLQQLRGWLQSETRQTLHCLVLRRCCRSFHYDETPQRPSAQCNMDHRVLKHSACFVAHATAMKERPHHSLGLAWWPLLGPTAKAVCLLNCQMGKDSAGTELQLSLEYCNPNTKDISNCFDLYLVAWLFSGRRTGDRDGCKSACKGASATVSRLKQLKLWALYESLQSDV